MQVTIFDWDDTLLCTTHLEMVQRQYGAIPAQVGNLVRDLQCGRAWSWEGCIVKQRVTDDGSADRECVRACRG